MNQCDKCKRMFRLHGWVHGRFQLWCSGCEFPPKPKKHKNPEIESVR